jgi:hypothetical protein
VDDEGLAHPDSRPKRRAELLAEKLGRTLAIRLRSNGSLRPRQERDQVKMKKKPNLWRSFLAFLDWIEKHKWLMGGVMAAMSYLFAPIVDRLTDWVFGAIALAAMLIFVKNRKHLRRPVVAFVLTTAVLVAYFALFVWLPPGLRGRLEILSLHGDSCGVARELHYARTRVFPLSVRIWYLQVTHTSVAGACNSQ